MTLASRLLVTFALGLIATGVVIGLLPAGSGGCGAAFSSGNAFTDPDGCKSDRALRRQIPVALIGLGLTAGAAAGVANESRLREAERSSAAQRRDG